MSRRLDLLGVLLATVALGAVSLGLINAADHGWRDPMSFSAVTAGLVAAAVLVGGELGASAPMLPLRLLRRSGVGTLSVVTLLHSLVVVGAVFIMAQFLQSGLGLTAARAGLGLLPWTGTMIFVPPLAGRFADRFGVRTTLVLGLASAAVGYGVLAALAAAGESSYAAYVVPLVVVGVGNSSAFPAITALVDRTAPPGQIGTAAGINSATRELGAVLGVALITLAFTAAGDTRSAADVVHGFSGGMAACALAALLGSAAADTLHVDAAPKISNREATGAA